MKKNKNYSIGLVIMAVILLVSLAEGGSKRRRGTAGAQELMIPLGSRGTAMAGANVAGITGIEAAQWNLAGIAGMDQSGEVMFSQLKWLAGVNVSYFGVASSFGSKSIYGFTLKTLDFGDIPVTTHLVPDGTGETYSPSFINLGFLYARRMTDRIFFGAGVKLVSETIMREKATGLAMDAGVQYRTGTGLKLGVSLRNLGLNMIFTGSDLEEFHQPEDTDFGTPLEPRRIALQSFEMPTTLEMGISYGPVNFGVGNATLAASFINNNFSFDEYRFGTEVNVLDILFLRGGLAYGFDPDLVDAELFTDENNNDNYDIGEEFEDENDNGFYDGNDEDWEFQSAEFIWGASYGFGLNLSKLTGFGLSVDYSFRTVKFFDGVSWLSFKIAF